MLSIEAVEKDLDREFVRRQAKKGFVH